MSDVLRRPPRRSVSSRVPAASIVANPSTLGTPCVCTWPGSILLSTPSRLIACSSTKHPSNEGARPSRSSNVRVAQARMRSPSAILHSHRRPSIRPSTCVHTKIQSAHDVYGRRYCVGNNCRRTKRAGNIMHDVRIDDVLPGYIARGRVLIHLGPASAATAGVARSVNIPPRSRMASSARQVELTGRVGTSTLFFFQRQCFPPRIFCTPPGMKSNHRLRPA